jgi:hypothetical protein
LATTTKRNPLIAALLEQLPADGTWPRGARVNWLRMMVMAMNQAYGEATEIVIDPVERESIRIVNALHTISQQLTSPAGVDVAPTRKALPAPPHIYIDHDGFVRQSPGDLQVTKEAIGALDVIYDYRGETGDLGSIIWADGSRGVVGVRADISAGAPK